MFKKHWGLQLLCKDTGGKHKYHTTAAFRIPYEVQFHITALLFYRFDVSPCSTSAVLIPEKHLCSFKMISMTGEQRPCSLWLPASLEEKRQHKMPFYNLRQKENKQRVIWASVEGLFSLWPLFIPSASDFDNGCPVAAPVLGVLQPKEKLLWRTPPPPLLCSLLLW